MPLTPFTINVGARGNPRLSFGAMATDAIAAQLAHLCLAEVGERVEAIPVRQGESFAIQSARHQLAQAELRDVTHPFVAADFDLSDAERMVLGQGFVGGLA